MPGLALKVVFESSLSLSSSESGSMECTAPLEASNLAAARRAPARLSPPEQSSAHLQPARNLRTKLPFAVGPRALSAPPCCRIPCKQPVSRLQLCASQARSGKSPSFVKCTHADVFLPHAPCPS